MPPTMESRSKTFLKQDMDDPSLRGSMPTQPPHYAKNTLQEKANLYIINLKDSAKGENQMLGLYLAAMDDSTYETQFVQVYERCKRLVYHTAYQIVQDSYLAEDVLQEVFLHLAQNFYTGVSGR